MAKDTGTDLGEHFEALIDRLVALGHYPNASEVLRAGLRLLEDSEIRLHALRQAIDEGVMSGPAARFDVEAFLADRMDASSHG